MNWRVKAVRVEVELEDETGKTEVHRVAGGLKYPMTDHIEIDPKYENVLGTVSSVEVTMDVTLVPVAGETLHRTIRDQTTLVLEESAASASVVERPTFER